MPEHPTRTGSCLCGGVRYKTTGPLRPVLACHCVQCRKQTGHHFAATAVQNRHFELTSAETLKWYRSSERAERGFCGECGSSLFWRRLDWDTISIGAGSIDGETGLVLEGHIFCEFAGDYYEIAGGKFQHARTGLMAEKPE